MAIASLPALAQTDTPQVMERMDHIEHDVMLHRPQFPTLNHTEADVRLTLEAAAEVAKVVV